MKAGVLVTCAGKVSFTYLSYVYTYWLAESVRNYHNVFLLLSLDATLLTS